jgi:hypothetical protein
MSRAEMSRIEGVVLKLLSTYRTLTLNKLNNMLRASASLNPR